MNNNRQGVVVAGLRTPFAKRQTAFKNFSPLDLGKLVCAELLERVDLDPKIVDQIVFGQVIPSIQAPNVAREIVLGIGIPPEITAYTVSKACITSYQTTVNVLQAIQEGAIECGIAGGTESASDVPIMVSKPLQDALHKASSVKTIAKRLAAFRKLSLPDLLPRPPAIAEPSTGETMGEAAERMAKENGISREAQDEFARRSHQRAAQAWREGKFADEVMAVHIAPDFKETLVEDNLLRPESDMATYAKLKPVFDKKYGTVTAGNSSPLTDGASALLLMNEAKAKALGMPILGKIRSYAFAALDPFDQLLLGPAYATPIALERAGMTLADMDLIDMHEAFAATVLSTIQAFESTIFAREKLNRSQPIGEVDWDKLNVNGGSIAMGHPFAATGTREIAQTLGELNRRGGGVALCTACAAGGMGAAMILEVTHD
ncbi:MAG: acetyl-CoA C-acyltransferase FadI [Candidatus Nitrosoglobus sp.]|jgi:acetyl-CoA acyltransferase